MKLFNFDYDRFFGSDPEFFITASPTTPTSAMIIPPAALEEDFGFKFIGETKNNKRILLEGAKFRFIEDGAAVELNFKEPINNPATFSDIVENSLGALSKAVKGINRGLNISYDVTDVFDPKKYWEGRSEKFLDCVRFGCDPDYVTEHYADFDKGCVIKDVSKHSERYAGGHFHIQNMSSDANVYARQVNIFPLILDLFLGTLNIQFARSRRTLSEEKLRLKYYGLPGRYRLQNYGNGINGIEYRPPSNFWVNDKNSVNAMFCLGNLCGNIIENDYAMDFIDLIKRDLRSLYYSLISFDKPASREFLRSGIELALSMNLLNVHDISNIHEFIN